MARFVGVLTRMGVPFRSKPSKRWWPCQTLPWLGFDVDARAMRVHRTVGKLEKGKSLRLQCAASTVGEGPSAKKALLCVSYLNFQGHGRCPGLSVTFAAVGAA